MSVDLMKTSAAPEAAVRPVAPAKGVGPLALPLAFAATLFLSATLLFLVQPMFAKMVLPLLGGTPAVWNTCIVFYQAALLLGYAYAHFTTAWLGVRRQAMIHAGILLLPLLALPITVAEGWVPPGDSNPIPWLLALLLVSVGLPFVVVSTSAPLLQKWFASTGHPAAKDPYFLYAASNLGSMLALLGYPTLVEPNLRLANQSLTWAVGYGILIVLTLGCAFLLWRSSKAAAMPATEDAGVVEGAVSPSAGRLTWGRRLHWIALAAVPSSLMLGVTTHVTTDVAAIPLLWVLPLALYLLTFILVYSRVGRRLDGWMVRLMPLVTLILVYQMVLKVRPGLLLEVALHLAVFFVITMVCHGELARLRPAPHYLTEYFLLMSVGGVLGGLCNALLAPVVFNRTFEYPLALAVACLLKPPGRSEGEPSSWKEDLTRALAVGGLSAFVAWMWFGSGVDMDEMAKKVGFGPVAFAWLLTSAIPIMACYAFSGRPRRFGLAVGAVLAGVVLLSDWKGLVQYRERSFFGQVVVQLDPKREYRWLVHGTTIHGWQSLDPERQGEPLTYFHRTGPVGQLFAAFDGEASPRRVGVTGLGIGTMASYARPGESWTFYEIDPAVIHVARDPRYFNFLDNCQARGVNLQLVPGDARLQMRTAPDHGYDLLLLDAFSSDSIPIHLLTREALELYLSKLGEDGVLMYNITNRYLDIEPVLAGLAREAGLTAYVQWDQDVADKPGKTPSKYVVMARRPELLERLVANGKWQPAQERPGFRTWTDDYSNLLSVVIWR
jgi:hypothetical protein